MATQSRLEEFDPTAPERWDTYGSQLSYLTANGIEDAVVKRATLPNVCGTATFEIAQDLISPAKLEEMSSVDIMAKLKAHFTPQPSVIAHQHAFYKCDQDPGESVANFVAALRCAARYCKFGELEDMLRDRLVCGLRNEKTQQWLFAKADLTFQSALVEALVAKAAQRATWEIRSPQS